MTGTETESDVLVQFHPQEWVDAPGQAHEWGRRQLVDAEDREPVTFAVPRADVTDDTGAVYPDESYEANRLRDHPAAPDWVNDWDGPYLVRTAVEE
ncbi:hypothetical protein GRX03_15185 [Halovenus sp. WSH3]|uniref:Uncharacterized protein n=1 Tax=Halovenus carboxidivorans TaxID=2692199 RepID=A0A6B0TC21_9EURY|nr:hypothetical protein [Halovenus carboxidivorans]MXR52942.1 hypothetical protein [Halovenus carboxidivorans]